MAGFTPSPLPGAERKAATITARPVLVSPASAPPAFPSPLASPGYSWQSQNTQSYSKRPAPSPARGGYQRGGYAKRARGAGGGRGRGAPAGGSYMQNAAYKQAKDNAEEIACVPITDLYTKPNGAVNGMFMILGTWNGEVSNAWLCEFCRINGLSSPVHRVCDRCCVSLCEDCWNAHFDSVSHGWSFPTVLPQYRVNIREYFTGEGSSEPNIAGKKGVSLTLPQLHEVIVRAPALLAQAGYPGYDAQPTEADGYDQQMDAAVGLAALPGPPAAVPTAAPGPAMPGV